MAPRIKNHRVGETRMQNCGLEAEIIGYRGSNDIDVQFPDGAKVEHRCYHEFVNGNIQHPNINKIKEQANQRIGEIRMQNCGLKATVIGYRGSNDIDVQFPDGAKVKHRQYREFVNGNIQHPNIDRYEQLRTTHKRLGEIKIQRCGLEAEIIDYRNSSDMDVQFQDGTLIKHGQYYRFAKGQMGHPTLYDCFGSNIKKIHPKAKSKIYHTRIYGIACITNNTYYYYCHCPICQTHEIWTFDEIKKHKCNHTLMQEREEQIKARRDKYTRSIKRFPSPRTPDKSRTTP